MASYLSAPISVTGPATALTTFGIGTAAANLAEGESNNQESASVLYRGVTVGHPGYENAVQGIAIPIGGHSDPERHNEGDTDSEFTSWSTSYGTARYFANRSGNGGVIMTANVPQSQQVASPDRFRENEVLVRGPITGASVTHIPR